MKKLFTDRKKLVVIPTAAFLFCLSLSVIPVFAQCNYSKANADKSAVQLVKCLGYEIRDPYKDNSNRRQITDELHKLGKEAIPALIDNISNIESLVPVKLDKPQSSGRRGTFISTGLISAFIVELILSKEKLVEKKGEIFALFILGTSEENYPYWYGDISNTSEKFIKADELPKIQKIYQDWWEKNKDNPIDVLRERWKRGERVLDGKEYKWM